MNIGTPADAHRILQLEVSMAMQAATMAAMMEKLEMVMNKLDRLTTGPTIGDAAEAARAKTMGPPVGENKVGTAGRLREAAEEADASTSRQPGETLSPGVMRTESPDPLQQAARDSWLQYHLNQGPGAPVPAGLPGPWSGSGEARTGATPLNPIHPKDVDKPEKICWKYR